LVVGGLIAAGAAGVVVLASFTLSRPGAPPPPAAPRPSPSAANAAVKTYATGVGERLNVTLDDGSTVELDTASRLEVAYSAARRELRLVAGQALFQVAHNKARPFIVTAGDRRITATGTAFEVRLDGRRVRVVLVEGHVVVADAAPGQAVPSAGQELSAGEQLVARPAGPMSVGPADLDRTSSWRRGQLIFRDDTLPAAVAEFNRYTTTRLVVDDPAVAALKISGVFGSASTDDFIAAIEAYFPVDAEMRATGTIALVKRPGTVASARR
jgi:transmembrane sensor